MTRNLLMPVFGMALVCGLVGCGGGESEYAKSVKEQTALLNEQAAIYEGVTDAASWKAAEAKVKAIADKQVAAAKKMAMPTADDAKGAEKLMADMAAATERLSKAATKAAAAAAK